MAIRDDIEFRCMDEPRIEFEPLADTTFPGAETIADACTYDINDDAGPAEDPVPEPVNRAPDEEAAAGIDVPRRGGADDLGEE